MAIAPRGFVTNNPLTVVAYTKLVVELLLENAVLAEKV